MSNKKSLHKEMAKKYKIIIGLLLIIFVIALALQIDDEIQPGIEKNYQNITSHKTSEAFVYLWGMQAAADEKPELVGQQLLKSLRKLEQGYSIDECKKQVEFEEYPDEKRLTHLKLDACTDKHNRCYTADFLFTHKFDADNITEDQQILLDRYYKFFSLNDFHTLTIPHIYTPIPPFRYIIDGSNIVNLIAIDKAKKQDYAKSQKLLIDNISRLRIFLIQADTLMTKMIYINALSASLNVLSMLKNQHKNHYNVKIKSLNKDERSLVAAMNYESGYYYNTSKSFANCPEYRYKKYKIPTWLYKTIFKPNISNNSLNKLSKQISDSSLLNSEEFTVKTSIKDPPIFNIRNLLGSIILEFNTIDVFHPYVARVFALDAKIVLFNKFKDTSISPSQIKNPFYKSEKTAYYSQDKKSVCFDVPFIKKERHRCLSLVK